MSDISTWQQENDWKIEVTLRSSEGARLRGSDDAKSTAPSDEKIPQSANSSEIEALDRELRAKLQRIAWVIVRDWSLAADAVQAAFLTLHQKWDEVLPENRTGWLIRAAQYSAHNIRRSQSSQDRLAELLFNQPLQEGRRDENSSRALDFLEDEIQALPVEQRQVVQLKLVEELTFQQIADRLAIPLGTALSRMRLAIERLRKVLREKDDPRE